MKWRCQHSLFSTGSCFFSGACHRIDPLFVS
jgi:hypothetical protein